MQIEGEHAFKWVLPSTSSNVFRSAEDKDLAAGVEKIRNTEYL